MYSDCLLLQSNPKGKGYQRHISTTLYAPTAWSQRLNVYWTHMLMRPFNLNPGDITVDFKLVCSSEEDMLLHQSTVMI